MLALLPAAAIVLAAAPSSSSLPGFCERCGHDCSQEGPDRREERPALEKLALRYARAMQAGLAEDVWAMLVPEEQTVSKAADVTTGWAGAPDSTLLPSLLWAKGHEARVRILAFDPSGKRIPQIVVLRDAGGKRGWRVYSGLREEREVISLIGDAREKESRFLHAEALDLYMKAIRLAATSGRSRWMDEAWMGHDRTVPKVNDPEAYRDYRKALSLRNVQLTEWGTVAGVVSNGGPRVLERVQLEITCEDSTWLVEVVDVLSGGYPDASGAPRKSALYYEPIAGGQTRAFIEPTPRCAGKPTARIADFDLRAAGESSPFEPAWGRFANPDASTREYQEYQLRFDVRRNGSREAIVEIHNLGNRAILEAELVLTCGEDSWPVRVGKVPAGGEARRDVSIAPAWLVVPDFRSCNKPSLVIDGLRLSPAAP